MRRADGADVTVEVKINTAQFEKEMRSLQDKIKKRVVTRAISAASLVMRDSIKKQSDFPVSKAPHMLRNKRVVNPGYMKSQIYRYNRRRQKTGVLTTTISVRGGKTGRVTKTGVVNDAYYWRWVHQGHVPRQPGGRIKGGVRRRALTRSRLKAAGKFITGQPFMHKGARLGDRAAADAFFRRFDEEWRKAQ